MLVPDVLAAYMRIQKIAWVIRAIIYKPFLGEIGAFSYIGKPLYINKLNRLFFGAKVRIYPHARLEVLHNSASIVFENNISIGQNLHIISGGDLIIKNNTTISVNVLITNVDHTYQKINTHVMEQPLIHKETRIDENSFIGYGAVIQAGTTQGNQCIVGANAVVEGSFLHIVSLLEFLRLSSSDMMTSQKVGKKLLRMENS